MRNKHAELALYSLVKKLTDETKKQSKIGNSPSFKYTVHEGVTALTVPLTIAVEDGANTEVLYPLINKLFDVYSNISLTISITDDALVGHLYLPVAKLRDKTVEIIKGEYSYKCATKLDIVNKPNNQLNNQTVLNFYTELAVSIGKSLKKSILLQVGEENVNNFEDSNTNLTLYSTPDNFITEQKYIAKSPVALLYNLITDDLVDYNELYINYRNYSKELNLHLEDKNLKAIHIKQSADDLGENLYFYTDNKMVITEPKPLVNTSYKHFRGLLKATSNQQSNLN